MIKQLVLAATLLLGFTMSTRAQTGIGTTTPNASAALEIKDTTKGLLIPRMTSARKYLVPSPVAGLMIYQTDSSMFSYYTGAAIGWTPVISQAGLANNFYTVRYPALTDNTQKIAPVTWVKDYIRSTLVFPKVFPDNSNSMLVDFTVPYNFISTNTDISINFPFIGSQTDGLTTTVRINNTSSSAIFLYFPISDINGVTQTPYTTNMMYTSWGYLPNYLEAGRTLIFKVTFNGPKQKWQVYNVDFLY